MLVSEGSKWVEKKSTGARAERWAGDGRLKAKGPALDTDLPGNDMSLSDSFPPKELQVERQFYPRATVKGAVIRDGKVPTLLIQG